MSQPETTWALVETLESISKLMNETHSFWAAPLDVTVPQWGILNAINALDTGGGVRVAEVARRVRVDPSFVTAQTKMLEKQRLVERKPSELDGRVVLMKLTDEATVGIEKIGRKRSDLNEFLFSDFEAGELETLLQAFRILEKRFSKAAHVLALDD